MTLPVQLSMLSTAGKVFQVEWSGNWAFYHIPPVGAWLLWLCLLPGAMMLEQATFPLDPEVPGEPFWTGWLSMDGMLQSMQMASSAIVYHGDLQNGAALDS